MCFRVLYFISQIFVSNRILLLGILLSSSFAQAQKQLVLLKKQEVVKRYNPGDDIVLRKKNQPILINSYVNNLSDTAVVTHNDTIPYHLIERVYFRQRSFLNKVGAVSVIVGVGFFLIDQINNVIVYGNKPRFDSYIINRSVPAVVIGLPLYLIQKKSRPLGHRYRLIMVKEGSAFYRSDRPIGYKSPYIPSN